LAEAALQRFAELVLVPLQSFAEEAAAARDNLVTQAASRRAEYKSELAVLTSRLAAAEQEKREQAAQCMEGRRLLRSSRESLAAGLEQDALRLQNAGGVERPSALRRPQQRRVSFSSLPLANEAFSPGGGSDRVEAAPAPKRLGPDSPAARLEASPLRTTCRVH